MLNNLLKALEAGVLFAVWAAIVFTGRTTVPGAETFIAWIQAALGILVGVHLYGVGARSGDKDAPQQEPPSADTKK